MAATYTITSQAPKKRAMPGGLFADVVDITFTTKPSGQPGLITIPATAFTPDEVDRLVTAAAGNIEAVQHL